MRALQLQDPIMTGPDVFDWQTFLKNKGLFTSTIDSEFGPKSDAATRAYQTNAGLAVDGVIGPVTLARAKTDGYQSTTGANIGGADTDVDTSSFAGQFSGVGMQFVARYYSDTVAKTLTQTEAQFLSNGGVNIVTVFENKNDDANLFSTVTGQSQAAKALELAAAVGQPAGTAIYFAIDFDAALDDVQGGITDYFTAIQAAFAAAPTQYSIGVYGSGLTCRVIRDAGLAKFTWLTGSIGFREYSTFRTQADIVQLAPPRSVFDDQLEIDDDIAQSPEFGAFQFAAAAAGIST